MTELAISYFASPMGYYASLIAIFFISGLIVAWPDKHSRS